MATGGGVVVFNGAIMSKDAAADWRQPVISGVQQQMGVLQASKRQARSAGRAGRPPLCLRRLQGLLWAGLSCRSPGSACVRSGLSEPFPRHPGEALAHSVAGWAAASARRALACLPSLCPPSAGPSLPAPLSDPPPDSPPDPPPGPALPCPALQEDIYLGRLSDDSEDVYAGGRALGACLPLGPRQLPALRGMRCTAAPLRCAAWGRPQASSRRSCERKLHGSILTREALSCARLPLAPTLLRPPAPPALPRPCRAQISWSCTAPCRATTRACCRRGSAGRATSGSRARRRSRSRRSWSWRVSAARLAGCSFRTGLDSGASFWFSSWKFRASGGHGYCATR